MVFDSILTVMQSGQKLQGIRWQKTFTKIDFLKNFICESQGESIRSIELHMGTWDRAYN